MSVLQWLLPTMQRHIQVLISRGLLQYRRELSDKRLRRRRVRKPCIRLERVVFCLSVRLLLLLLLLSIHLLWCVLQSVLGFLLLLHLLQPAAIELLISLILRPVPSS